jgi:hypothetical protein
LIVGDLTNTVGLLLIGSEDVMASFVILGMIGTGLIVAGTRLVTGA